MSSRTRDIGHHYAFGRAKRKAKEKKEGIDQLVISKTRKLTQYIGGHGVITSEAGNITTGTIAAEGKQ